MNSQTIGKLGESYACDFLLDNGYHILRRNFRYGKLSEIDVIAIKFKTISFIEVKTRQEFEAKEHFKSINNFKVLKIRRGISRFLAINQKFYDYHTEIKAIIVLINPYTKGHKVVFYDYLD